MIVLESKRKIPMLWFIKTTLYLRLKEIRKSLLIPILALIMFGLLMSFSLSYAVSRKLDTSDFYFFYKHFAFVLIGMIAMIFFTFVDLKKITSISIIFYAICVFLLILVLFNVSSSVKGAKRWIDIGMISIQPSEILKPFFIIVHSFLVYKFWKDDDINYILTSIASFVVCVMLFALEPDYGMIIVYSFIVGIQILFSPIKIRYTMLVALVFIATLIALVFCFDHVRFRVLTFLGMGDGDNYQLNIALNAIKDGGLFGNGIGMSNLKSKLPDAHNDFIFAVIGEEIGLFGYIFIALFYFTIFISVITFILEENYYIKKHAFIKNEVSMIDEYYINRTMAVSILGIFLISFTINSFVSLGLFPTKGMTLPLVSYGGSSILSHCIMAGILLNITKKKHRYLRLASIG
jgi:cell division protein FtsW